jgi:hypothetical protein
MKGFTDDGDKNDDCCLTSILMHVFFPYGGYTPGLPSFKPERTNKEITWCIL